MGEDDVFDDGEAEAGALALFVPLEGGAETRLLRRMRQRVTKPR